MADVPIEERLARQAGQRFGGGIQNARPKIQRVPAFLRQNPEFAKYCSPMITSFGPIHHRNENLLLGRQLKAQWTSLYIREYGEKTGTSTNAAAEFLLNAVEAGIGELRELFAADLIVGYNDEDLAWMLFVDGCSLLYYMEHVDAHCPEELMLKLDQLMYIWRDVGLLENQLPMRLLELLSKTQGGDLWHLLANFNKIGEVKRSRQTIVVPPDVPKPTHILDYARSYLTYIENGNNVRNNAGNQQGGVEGNQQDGVGIGNGNNVANQQHVVDIENGNNVGNQQHGDEAPPGVEEFLKQTYKNIRDLKKAGIQVKENKTQAWIWHNVSFTSKWFSGELRLPVFVFDNVAPYFFRNLIAYEMCPDFRNNFECCSFFSFMDSLVDDAEDVKELRLAGVFQNLLGSDEELAKLFNDIGHDLPTKMFNNKRNVVVAYSEKYIQVKHQMEKHYSTKWKTWLAEFRNTYFNTPWSLSAFLAAVLALVLTFIQTWYAIYPKRDSQVGFASIVSNKVTM